MKIFKQSTFDAWPLEDESVQSIIVSPPYYAKRIYNIPDIIIGGDKECVHNFDENNFCNLCNGWLGQYGNEKDFGSEIFSDSEYYKIKVSLTKEERIYLFNELIKRGIIA